MVFQKSQGNLIVQTGHVLRFGAQKLTAELMGKREELLSKVFVIIIITILGLLPDIYLLQVFPHFFLSCAELIQFFTTCFRCGMSVHLVSGLFLLLLNSLDVDSRISSVLRLSLKRNDLSSPSPLESYDKFDNVSNFCFVSYFYVQFLCSLSDSQHRSLHIFLRTWSLFINLFAAVQPSLHLDLEISSIILVTFNLILIMFGLLSLLVSIH